MVRTKNPNFGADKEVEVEEEVDYTMRYSYPFLLKCEWENEVFRKFNNSDITRPRYLDWDLIRDLKIAAKVTKYLKNLGLDTFARTVDYSGYDYFCYEFLTTMSLSADKKKIGVRMKDREYQINLARMKSVFGFPTGGERERPRGFNVNAVWTKLAGFNNWNSSGMPNGYITDPALAIVYKFLTYNVSGKDQTNKVNSTEVYLLSCALNDTKFHCVREFIHSEIAKRRLPPIVPDPEAGPSTATNEEEEEEPLSPEQQPHVTISRGFYQRFQNDL
ncbi:hypothetical protein C2S53_014380 [Perilla frutescens var. hirtella]|uniref:Arabidopsis retrotransposon Orf1 C-terminal domain-containing protein n=1 Tax=Perilla frutescens var. hirtella TaxID=608512 RepID=A0AAD4PAA5_PERFH|nr:hypothetical protein C2S53_014380 [Perilla frutescens var. hirtella]